MTKIYIPIFKDIKINSFRPLCMNELGQQAIHTYNFPPFIDGSCRREPDLEHSFPSISALCRQGKFAPHLKKNDIIVYITVGGRYQPYKEKHHRLIAILQVEEIYKTHQDAQIGYSKLEHPIPSNCMVVDNHPYDFDKTAGNFGKTSDMKNYLKHTIQQREKIGQRRVELWNNSYLNKSQRWTCFVQTKKLYCNLTEPLPIFKRDFEIPNTRQPKKISEQQLKKLGELVGLDIVLGH